MRAVAESTNLSTNLTPRSIEAARYRYRHVLPFLGRALQDLVLTRAAAQGTPVENRRVVVVPTTAEARADVLRLKRRGELATEVSYLRCCCQRDSY